MDAKLRKTEREALSGDPEAAERLAHLRARAAPPSEFEGLIINASNYSCISDGTIFGSMIVPESNTYLHSYTVHVDTVDGPIQLHLKVNEEIVSSMMLTQSDLTQIAASNYMVSLQAGDIINYAITGFANSIHITTRLAVIP